MAPKALRATSKYQDKSIACEVWLNLCLLALALLLWSRNA